MFISQLIKSTDISYNGKDEDIKYITDNSEKCTKGSIFVCHDNARKYIASAIEKGAVLVVCSQMEEGVNCALTKDTRKAYALLCAEFFSNSHKNLRLIGVTGTNGKTTTCSMIYTMLTLAGKRCGLVSSVKNDTCQKESVATLTTPDCFSLHRMLYEMKNAGAEFCVIEASSQGLSQGRLYGLSFEVGVFTNLASDHLDYHGDINDYRLSKMALFTQCDFSLTNTDDSNGGEVVSFTRNRNGASYSIESNESDYTAKCIELSENETNYVFVGNSIIHRINLKVPGRFNVYNSLGAIGACLHLGLSLRQCSEGLRNFHGVKGRMEIVPTDRDFTLIIDYAHTEESLKQCLLFLNSIKKGRIITLFGCGGNRDKSKRALMGKVVASLSDEAIITSDNPRDEMPQDIIDDILEGMKDSKIFTFIHTNRKKAIEEALKRGKKDDIILIAGKGHETTQQIGSELLPFDEREIIKEILNK